MSALIFAEFHDSAHETLRRAVDECTAKLKLKTDDAEMAVRIAHKVWDNGASKAAAVGAARRYAYRAYQWDNPEYA